MAAKFGTSGLRGLSTELVGSVSALYATAFARFLFDNRLAAVGDRVCVAKDFRDSSPQIAATVMAALARAGLRPVDCGEVPTPALALYAMGRGEAAIMVTGSHIPADRNGIKFYRPDGEIGKADEMAITTRAAELKEDEVANRVQRGQGEDHAGAVAAIFMERNMAVLSAGALAGLRIGVYQHSTVARDMLVDVLRGYGAEVLELGRSEVFVPVDTEAVSKETEEKLRAWAGEHRLDAIVSADGDGDRPLVADEQGTPLRGDLLGLVAAKFLKAHLIVTPVTSNSGIEEAGDFEVVRTRVGSPFVIAAMQLALEAGNSGVLGFEANGGLMLASDFEVNDRRIVALPTRDCFLPALAVLSMAAQRKIKLSDLVSEYRLPVAAADRLTDFPVEKSEALMSYLRSSSDNLAAFLKPVGKPATTSEIDGLRVTLQGGDVIHLRPSGNAPEMRCYVEAHDERKAEDLLRKGLAALAAWQPA